MVRSGSRYVVDRLVGILGVVLVVYTMTFLLISATPGNPFAARTNRRLPPETLASIEASFGLDEPWYVQYVTYLRNALRGDFGPSYSQQGREVNDMITSGLGTTVALVAAALVLGVVVGTVLGVVAARREGTAVDHAIGVFTTTGVAVPPFVSIPILVIVLGVYAQLVPTGGWDGLFSRSAIVPIVALAIEPAAIVTWFTRSSLIDVLKSDYIRTARAQGLSGSKLYYSRGLRNAVAPVLAILGTEVAALFAAVLFAENILNIPGFGREMVLALGARDYPVVLAGTLILTAIIATANLVVDLLLAVADPRVRVGREAR